MPFRFQKHYTLDEARALIPQLRDRLARAQQLRRRLDHIEERVTQMLASGDDVGGKPVDEMVRLSADFGGVIAEFQAREIQIKDLSRGLVDFPAVIGGREVFLCWEQDEDDIEFWHELDAGYAGRERL